MYSEDIDQDLYAFDTMINDGSLQGNTPIKDFRLIHMKNNTLSMSETYIKEKNSKNSFFRLVFYIFIIVLLGLICCILFYQFYFKKRLLRQKIIGKNPNIIDGNVQLQNRGQKQNTMGNETKIQNSQEERISNSKEEPYDKSKPNAQSQQKKISNPTSIGQGNYFEFE